MIDDVPARVNQETKVIVKNLTKLCFCRLCTILHIIKRMVYQWNENKAAANFRKHGIDFADAVSVFSDDLAITAPDGRFDEERFVTMGLDALGRVLVVVYTWRGQEIRLISARSATHQERRQYEEG